MDLSMVGVLLVVCPTYLDANFGSSEGGARCRGSIDPASIYSMIMINSLTLTS